MEMLYLSDNHISDISVLSELTGINLLYLDNNQIVNITPLSGLTGLGKYTVYRSGERVEEREGVKVYLGLHNNQISDIQPLADNEGLSKRDVLDLGNGIDLRGNPLSDKSLDIGIPQLEERGVDVLYDITRPPKTWYVDDDRADYPDADFTKIQDAVNAVRVGDIIIVYPGTYAENVDVNKSYLTISSKSGADSTIVQAVNPEDDVFEVTADYVDISGFAVKGATVRHAGIDLYYANHCNISENNISNNGGGIYLFHSNDNTLTNNNANSNNRFGIALWHSDKNTLIDNNASNNDYGIRLFHSSHNEITKNNVYPNEINGVETNFSNENKIYMNNFSGSISISTPPQIEWAS
jgi:parallel beta-helix repeat protein